MSNYSRELLHYRYRPCRWKAICMQDNYVTKVKYFEFLIVYYVTAGCYGCLYTRTAKNTIGCGKAFAVC